MKICRRMGETKQIVQVNGGNILLFELAFRLLTLPLLLQAVAALFRLSVRASGYSYVTVSNLVSYLLRPVTIAILVLMAAILLVGVSIEAAGLLAAYQAAALSRKMSAFSMFAAGIRLTVSEIRKRNLRLFLVLAVHGLVLHSFLIYRMLCHVKAVKFILPALLAENWGRLLLVGVIVGAVVISLPTIFICFGCMLEQRSFRGGFLRSRELLRGNRVQVVGTLVLCNLAVTAVTVVLYLIAVVIVAVFAVWFADRRLELILVLEARDRIEMVLMPLMSIALMSVNYGALTVLYVQLDRKRQNKERWKFEAGEHAGLPWMSRPQPDGGAGTSDGIERRSNVRRFLPGQCAGGGSAEGSAAHSASGRIDERTGEHDACDGGSGRSDGGFCRAGCAGDAGWCAGIVP